MKTLLANLAWRIHEIANDKAIKRYELAMLIEDSEPSVYYGMLTIPKEKWSDETKAIMAMYERKFNR